MSIFKGNSGSFVVSMIQLSMGDGKEAKLTELMPVVE
jgi:hypothetical protein